MPLRCGHCAGAWSKGIALTSSHTSAHRHETGRNDYPCASTTLTERDDAPRSQVTGHRLVRNHLVSGSKVGVPRFPSRTVDPRADYVYRRYRRPVFPGLPQHSRRSQTRLSLPNHVGLASITTPHGADRPPDGMECRGVDLRLIGLRVMTNGRRLRRRSSSSSTKSSATLTGKLGKGHDSA